MAVQREATQNFTYALQQCYAAVITFHAYPPDVTPLREVRLAEQGMSKTLYPAFND